MPKRPIVGQPVISADGTALTKDKIKHRVRSLGKQIERDYQGKTMTVVSILSGAVRFTADLLNFIEEIQLQLAFVQVESYRSGTTSGVLQLGSLSERDISGQNVLIVDDIMDSGKTLSKIAAIANVFEPESLKTCVFLKKTKPRRFQIEPEYVGFEIPDEFVVGYGMDYNGMYRNLSLITRLNE
jgi:hypoxanthine phosphoribosyltransferase